MTSHLVALDAKRGAPTEFRVFPKGKVDTSKGLFLFDDKAAKAVMAEYRRQGNDLSIDFEHMAVQDPPIKAPAAGWFKLEMRDDGLYAVNVKWTDAAREHLEAKEYRYFSPAFVTEEKTGRILRLINVALTNVPATRNMKPLVAAAAKGKAMPAEVKTETLGKKVTEEFKKKTTEDTDDVDADDVDADDDNAADDVDADDTDTKADDDAATDDTDADDTDADDDDDDDGEDDDDDDGEDDDDALKAKKTKKAAPPLAKTKKLSLTDSVRVITGTADRRKQIAKLAAMSVEVQHVRKLSARVEELEARDRSRTARRLVNRAVADLRLPPAKKKMALSLAERDPSLGTLRIFLDALPKPVVSAQHAKQASIGSVTTVVLSDDDKKVCAAMGIPTEEFLKIKAARGAA